MTFEKKNNIYMTLGLDQVSGDVYKVELGSPLNIQSGEQIEVALCNISYNTAGTAFWNAPISVFEVYNPKLCTPITSTPAPMMYDEGAVETSMSTSDDAVSSPPSDFDDVVQHYSASSLSVVFTRAQLENGEYNLENLCSSLNSELQSKMPSSFYPSQCQFIYNSVIDRAEIRIDGNSSLAPEDRWTLVVYHPLSAYLGLTDRTDRRATFAFVSKINFVALLEFEVIWGQRGPLTISFSFLGSACWKDN